MPPPAGDAPAATVGTVLGGRYRVEGVIGSGGMATVFCALDQRDGDREVALKLLRREIASDPQAIERLRREGAVLGAIHHPGVVRYLDQGVAPDGRLYLVMELLSGETLGDRIRAAPRLSPRALGPVVEAVCGALAAAHDAGVLHRDLKPDNVFLPDDPAAGAAKLLDFGIAKVFGTESLTRTGQIVGTPRYMAPEQLTAEPDLDGRVDVYAVGAMLYEALAGVPPFTGGPADLIVAILDGRAAPLGSLRPDLPAELVTVVTRAMARNREARFRTAGELAAAWARAVGQLPRTRHGLSVPTPRPADVRTAALGQMAAPPAGHAARGSLDPGTFHALPARPPVAAPPPAAAPAHPAAPPAVAPPPAAGGDAPSPGEGAYDPGATTTGAMTLPVRRAGPGAIAAVGLLVGALSAGAAVLLWRGAGGETPPGAKAPGPAASGPETSAIEPPAPGASRLDARAPTPPPGVSAPAPLAAPAAGVPGAEHPGATDPGAQARDAAEPGGPAPGDGARAARRSAARRERRARQPPPATPAPPSPWTTEPPAPVAQAELPVSDLLRNARAALRRGDPGSCLSLVDEAEGRGALPAVAYRLKGDCHRAAGQTVEARRAYERFCRLHPTHPAIPELRPIVEGLGGLCR